MSEIKFDFECSLHHVEAYSRVLQMTLLSNQLYPHILSIRQYFQSVPLQSCKVHHQILL